MRSKEKVGIKETVTTEVVVANTLYDPTVDSHLDDMQKLAKSKKAAQRKVLASGLLREGFFGERVLVVKPNGEHSIIEEKS